MNTNPFRWDCVVGPSGNIFSHSLGGVRCQLQHYPSQEVRSDLGNQISKRGRYIAEVHFWTPPGQMYVVARGGGVRLGLFLSHCYSNRWTMPKDIQWIGSASCCVLRVFWRGIVESCKRGWTLQRACFLMIVLFLVPASLVLLSFSRWLLANNRRMYRR